MSNVLDIEINGADKIIAGLDKFPEEIIRNFEMAGNEAGEEIIQTQGLAKYPPKTAANAPPTPYYIRGTGTQYKSHNRGESEDYKSQYYVKTTGMGTVIGNRASYATYLAGDKTSGSPHDQAQAMKKIGWRKLIDVAKEKLTKITVIYNKWTQYTINKLGL